MRIIITILLAAGVLSAEAQKLPGVQQASVKAPANIKIDGKADEWADRFEAYNPATELWYTIANDDKRLYLTILANNQSTYGVVNRIIASGLTFTVANNKVKGSKGVSVTYPVTGDPQIHFFSFFSNNEGVSIAATDSVIKMYNLKLEKLFKLIKVEGVTGMDTISVYNEVGIEASEKFDIKKNYTIELSIPIALVRNQINTTNTLSYKITIRGGKATIFDTNSARIEGGGSEPAVVKMRDDIVSAINRMDAVYKSSTDFWGEYTLAK